MKTQFCPEANRVGLIDEQLSTFGELKFGCSLTQIIPEKCTLADLKLNELINIDQNSLIFFENCRSNNQVVFSPNHLFLNRILRLCNAEQIDLRLVKIHHSNKVICNASQNPVFHFLKCLFLWKADLVTVESVVLKFENLSILDSVVVPMRELFQKEPSLKFVNKDFEFYVNFLKYYANAN